MKKPRLFWVTDQRDLPQRKFTAGLLNGGCGILEAGLEDWFSPAKELEPDLIVFWCSKDCPANFLATAQELKHFSARTPIKAVVANNSEELAIGALRAGIGDYLKMPCTFAEFAASIRHCLSHSFPSTASGIRKSSPG